MPTHRAARGRTAPVPAGADAKSSRRWPRRLAWVAAAVLTSAAVLGGVVYAGCRSGANACVGEKMQAGTTGAEVFARNCASCHGPQGAGGTGPAFTAGGALSGLTFGQRVEKIGRGKPLNAMPRWRGKLSADQIRMVAAYTQILSGQPPEPTVAGVR